jgi:signal transduction histidine kinase
MTAVTATPGDTLIFGSWSRRTGATAAVALAVAAVAWSTTLGESDQDYLLAHAVGAVPFLVAASVFTAVVLRACPREYLGFWRRWFAAVVAGTGAAVAGVGAVLLDARALEVVDMVLLVASLPLWMSATLLMVRAQAGRRDMTVDVIDAASALIVLGAPGVLLLAESVGESTELVFAVPFALAVLLTPAGLYLSFVNLERIPRGERGAQAIGLALAAAFTINVTLQLARLLAHIESDLSVFVAFHVAQMALLMVLPLWAHRRTTGRLARLAPEQQFRASNPMPYVSAVVLPPLALFVYATRDTRPWGVAFLVVVLLAVIVLNAIRYTLMSRESSRLSTELADMAEERRRLLADMVRALEDDRHRTVAELHTQAVGSLATLATLIQTAYVTLPNDTAQAVRETIARMSADLADRAEELRQLMVAMRPGSGGNGRDEDSVLGTALLAYASELYRGGETETVHVHVDPDLELDRSTATIVYRIAQEALLNAARHARAQSVSVAVTGGEAGVVVEVVDDGVGFEPGEAAAGSGLATMQLFTNLGRGELTIRSSRGQGTRIRAELGIRAAEGGAAAPSPERGLRLVASPDPTD